MWNGHVLGLCFLLIVLQACQRPVFEPIYCDEWQAVDPSTGAVFEFGVWQICGIGKR